MEVHLRLTRGSASVVLDLFENDPVNMNKLFSNIETFDIQGSYSQTFRVPITENNQSFFGALYDPTNTGFDLKTKIDAQLSCDTIPIYEGYCQVKKMITRDEITHELEIAFFATTPTIKSEINNKKIADLTDLPNLNHAMTIANVTSPPANTLWSLIERGQKFSEGGEVGTRRVFDVNNPLFVGDLTPSVNYLYLWRQIFADAGYTYESDFIDNTLADYWMPFSNSQFISTEQDADNIGFGIFRSTDYAFTSVANNATPLNSANSFVETYDNGGNVTSGQFIAPYYAYYTFKIQVTWKKAEIPTGQTAVMDWRFYDQATGLPIQAINGASNTSFITQEDTFFTFEYVRTYLLNVGDTIELAAVTGINFGSTSYTIKGGSGWSLVTTSTALQGADVDLVRNAPDYKQEDFLRDVLKAHNLVFIPDPNVPNKIVVETFTDYIGSGETKDWTNKLEVGSKDVVIYPTTDIQNKNLVFTYTAGGDYLSDIFVKQGGRVYGEKRIDNTDNDFATGDKKVELVLRSTPCNEISGTNIPVPKFVDANGNYIVPFARMLYNAGVAPIAIFDEVEEEGAITNVPILSHFSESNPTLTDYDLNWNAETPLQTYTALPFNNLYNLYWARYYNELYSLDSRIMEGYFQLSLSDYITAQFNDRIFIKNSYWRILEINDYYVGSDGLTRVKLAKIVQERADCEFTPSTIGTTGKVTFVDANGDTSNGSQECCERYLYHWDSSKGECFAFGFSGQAPPVDPLAVSKTLVSGFNNDISSGSPRVDVVGDGNTVGVGNNFSTVRGVNNTIANNTGIALVAGISGRVRNKGLHYADDVNGATTQLGVIPMYTKASLPSTGSTAVLKLTDGEYLNIQDGTVMSCILNVIVLDDDSLDFTSCCFAFGLQKNTVASATSISTVANSGTGHSISLSIDTTTDTDEHRLVLTFTGGGSYPTTVTVSASLRYTQLL